MAQGEKDNQEKPFWAQKPEEVFELLNTNRDGLSTIEAEERLKLGKNILPQEKRGRKLKIIIGQFKSPLIFILLIAGGITLALQEFRDSAFILSAVVINAALGFYQENKAETALSKLQTYVKERARVIRDGNEKEIDASELVKGDIIKLSIGMRVPADARVFMTNDFTTDEAILTGESLPARKNVQEVEVKTGITDQDSMVFSGTLVSNGVGLAVIVRTGIDTEIGKIAALIEGKEDETTPLQEAIRKFSLWIGFGLFVLTLILFGFGLYAGFGLYEMFLITVAVAVSAIPEGLPIALTVILAVGVERLAKRKGVVRKLLAAETLGSTTLILTDKTGTLTEARMELSEIVSEIPHEEILEKALLAAEAVIENPESSPADWRVIGSPLESAIIQAGAKYKVLLPELRDKHEILELKPFNSTDKFSAVRLKIDGREHWIYMGAPDVLIKNTRISAAEKDKLLAHVDELAYSGYRLLGVLENSTFLGFLAFNDPVRAGLTEVIKEVANAGIKTVIATGDHKGTVLAVAKELEITVADDEILTGSELQELDDKELSERLASIKIFARVSPVDKLRLVKLYQERGEVVAMTGDGVNDAPALKGADIGIAVGSGTDVAKGTADLVILDDNFETIVLAIKEGRGILDNMRKVIVYLFSDTLDELFLIGGSIMLGMTMPLNALQILWVNFFADSFPAVAFAFEDEKNTLKQKPSQLKSLIDREMKFLIVIIGTISSVLLLVLYYVLLQKGYPGDIVRTFIFASFSVYTLFLTFSIKSLRESIFRYNPFSNLYLVGGVAIGMVLTLIAIYFPAAQSLLDTVALPFNWLISVAVVGIVNILAVEFGKYLFRNR